MTNWRLTNGNKLLAERRQEAQAYRATQTRPPTAHIADPAAEFATQRSGIPPYPEVHLDYEVLGYTCDPPTDVVLNHLGVASLEDLTTSHMPAPVAQAYLAGLESVRQWRRSLGQLAQNENKGRMFTVCSGDLGGGKTHMAEAVLASFFTITPPLDVEEYRVYSDGSANFSLDRRGGRFYTAKDLMDQMATIDGDKVTIHSVVRPTDRIIIVDDVGREGKRKWDSRDEESQTKTIRQLYYDFFNHCYQRGKAGNPVNIFLTSNLMWSEMANFFNDATMDRINELSPRGHVWEMKGVPSYRAQKSGRTS